MAFDLPLWKINTGQQVLSFLEPKIWTKFSNSTRNAKTGFLHTYSKEILSWRNFKKTVQVNKLVCIQNKRLKQFSLFILVSPSFNTTYAFIINFAWIYFKCDPNWNKNLVIFLRQSKRYMYMYNVYVYINIYIYICIYIIYIIYYIHILYIYISGPILEIKGSVRNV